LEGELKIPADVESSSAVEAGSVIGVEVIAAVAAMPGRSGIA